MNASDPVIDRIADVNPVPPGTRRDDWEYAQADRILSRVVNSQPAGPPRRGRGSWLAKLCVAVVAASAGAVAAVVIVATDNVRPTGTRGSPAQVAGDHAGRNAHTNVTKPPLEARQIRRPRTQGSKPRERVATTTSSHVAPSAPTLASALATRPTSGTNYKTPAAPAPTRRRTTTPTVSAGPTTHKGSPVPSPGNVETTPSVSAGPTTHKGSPAPSPGNVDTTPSVSAGPTAPGSKVTPPSKSPDRSGSAG